MHHNFQQSQKQSTKKVQKRRQNTLFTSEQEVRIVQLHVCMMLLSGILAKVYKLNKYILIWHKHKLIP